MCTTKTTVTRYCPTCNDDREFSLASRRETHTVRNVEVTADIPVFVCVHCGCELYDPANDPMVVLYDAYRRTEGLLDAEDIRRIREQYGLSRETFAGLLGMSPASLYRYEGGGLQDEAHDELIRGCDDLHRMIDLVNRRRDRLSDLQYRRFMEAIQELPVPLHTIIWSENFPVDDEFCGGRPFGYILYAHVVQKLCTIAGPVFNTKLNKLLFYVDFLAHKALGHSITGSPYRAIQHGPVPTDYDTLLERLEQDGYITREEVDFGDYAGVRICVGKTTTHLDKLPDPGECAVIEHVAKHFHHFNAKAIRDLSHREAAYLQTPQRKLISYRHAAQLSLDLPVHTGG